MLDAWTPGYIPAEIKIGQILAIVSVSLYLGQQGLQAMRQGRGVVTFSMLAGFGFSFTPGFVFATDTALFVATALAGTATAMSWPRMPLGLFLAAVGGAALGTAAHPVDAEWPDAVIVVAANLLGANLLVISIAGFANWVQNRSHRFWLPIGIRVVGAWALAISTMMLAFSLTR